MTTQATGLEIDGVEFTVHAVNTLVVGSGAAGLNAALQVFEHGQPEVMILTEDWFAGTSRNAGSDKQTYYKQGLAGAPDSPREMARDIWQGGGMHGDIVLCEAQHSLQAFFNLVRLGVPFPHDRFGTYVGFRTDHDPRGRGTSAGPLTSRYMCERLGDAVRARGIEVLDGHELVDLITEDDAEGRRKVVGVVALDRSRCDSDSFGLVLVNAVNVVLATGGPGGLYRTSVYPESQIGSLGPALAAGAAARNLTESQFGLASVGVRWNVSGSYQQVIPSYISTDAAGENEREFLQPFFPDRTTLAGAIFRKGYQWPFDAAKVADHGSSLIDLLVFREIVHEGRRVYLDFTRNLGDAPFSLDLLDAEARDYLEKSRAVGETPYARLQAMNPAAIELYRSHGIELEHDRLEIAVCAQHLNGGLAANIWWESNLRHLFPVGEVCGTHGFRRPGGSSLNAGQVGGIRAALYITRRYAEPPPALDVFRARAESTARTSLQFARRVSAAAGPEPRFTPDAALAELQERMSSTAAHIRDRARVARAVPEAWALVRRMAAELQTQTRADLPRAFRAADLALAHAVFLEAIHEYLGRGGKSRGSALVVDAAGRLPVPQLDDAWRYAMNPADAFVDRKILEVRLTGETEVEKQWTDPRPLPDDDGWFEVVWGDYVNDRVIRRDPASPVTRYQP